MIRVFENNQWLGVLLLLFGLAGCSETTGGGTPLLDLQSDTLDFKTVSVGWEKQLTVAITNRGEGILQVQSIEIEGTDAAGFSVTSARSFELGGGAGDLIQVRFAPKSSGEKLGTMKVTTNAGTSDIALKGIGKAPGSGNDVVIATLVAVAPVVDGDGSDPVWNVTAPTPLTFSQVMPESKLDLFSSDSRRLPFNGEMKAVYTVDSVYFLISYADPDAETTPDQWMLTGSDPSSDWKHESSEQDGLSLIWPIASTVEGDQGESFSTVGCAATCHTTASLDNYEGGHYPHKGVVDIWYWQSGLSNPLGRADDQVAYGLDITPIAGQRVPDSGPAIITPNFQEGEQGLPLNMAGGDNGDFEPGLHLWGPTSIPFDPTKPNPATTQPWRVGDKVPGWAFYEPSGEQAQLRAKGSYNDGRWRVELARALNTQSVNDVAFDISQIVYFGLAVHDRQRKFTQDEYRVLPSFPQPSHYGVPLMQLIFN